MPRKSSHKIFLTDKEFAWLQRVVPRHAKALESKVGTDSTAKRLKEATEKLAEKLALPPQGDLASNQLVFESNRQDLRIIQQIVRVEYEAVTTHVIPGYQERMAKDPSRYKQYLDASVAHSEMLLGLLNKVNERLGA